MKIAIVMARGGSKRIPEKNIKLMAGKPIITLAIENIIKTNFFDEIIVSTDDPNIAKIAMNSGASVPFIRPKNLSDDFSNTIDVMNHSVNYIQGEYENVSLISCFYATSIFFNKSDINKAFMLYEKDVNRFVVSAHKIDSRFLRGFSYNNNELNCILPKFKDFRTQDLPDIYIDAAQFYMASPKTWLTKKKLFSKKTAFIELDKNSLVDIDFPSDWLLAEKVFLKNNEKK